MDNLWTRRTNANKLSLSTPGSGQNDTGSTGRSFSSSSKRFGGESSSHGSRNPFNEIKSPASALASPGAAANAFALGTGAFSNFGAKTPKSGGNPFEQGLKTPSTEKSSKEANGHGNGVSKSAAEPNAKPDATTQANKDKRHADQSANHLLRNSWCFWYRPSIPKNIGYIPYEDTVHGIAAFSTAEEFWAVYRHLKRPSALPLVSDYHLFKKGVRPIWEDEENRKGGKWVVRLKKGVADRYWEDLMLALIGDQFGDAGDEICGAVMSVRNGEDILSIWCARDGGRVLKIRETFKRVLNFPPDTKIEWKVHEESIQQRITVEESRKERANQHKAGNKQSNPRQAQQQQGIDDSNQAPQAS